MNSKKRFVERWWFVGIVLPVIASLITDYHKEVSLLTTAKNCILWLWNGIIFLLTAKIAVYWIVILLVVITLVLLLINNVKGITKPYLQYTSDIFIKWKWEWSYSGNRIINLTPLCPHCNTILKYHDGVNEYSKFAECPRCNRVYTTKASQKRDTDIAEFEDIARIEMLIIDNVKKSNFPHA